MIIKKTKIKEIFLVLSAERKNNVRTTLSEKFNITVDTAKNHWVLAGKIPEENIDEVLEIVKEQARQQSDNIKDLIDAV